LRLQYSDLDIPLEPQKGAGRMAHTPVLVIVVVKTSGITLVIAII
jgi:hypothetical protein